MKKLEAVMQIGATPAVVWAILTDTKALATAGLGIIALGGDMRVGGRLKLVNEVVPGRTFALTPPRSIRPGAWSGAMGCRWACSPGCGALR